MGRGGETEKKGEKEIGLSSVFLFTTRKWEIVTGGNRRRVDHPTEITQGASIVRG